MSATSSLCGLTLGVVTGLLLTSTASGQSFENSGARKIVSIGCHAVDGTCYVGLSGPEFIKDANNCPTPGTAQFRWDNADAHGKRAYSSLMAAFLAQKSVDVTIYGCTSQKLPKLVWYNITN
ncbi:MAG: hypothetical protein ACRCWJ_12590 [Casimicrobium sp.]